MREVTNQAGTVGVGQVLDLAADAVVNYGHGITNQGLIKGDGQLGGPFHNAATGEFRAEPGKSIQVTGTNSINDGQINMLGGTLEFAKDFTCNPGGLVTGGGNLSAVGQAVISTDAYVAHQMVLQFHAAKIDIRGKVFVAPQATLYFDSPLPAVLGGLFDLDHGTVVANHGLRFGTQQMSDEAGGLLWLEMQLAEQARRDQEAYDDLVFGHNVGHANATPLEYNFNHLL